MMSAAVENACGLAGLHTRTGDGGVRIVETFDQGVHRRYRLLSATVGPTGGYRILSSSDKILRVDPEGLLGTEEPWVLSYTLDISNQVDVLFVAEVFDRIEGNPGELVLGPIHELTGQPPTRAAFRPADEDLPGFEEGDDDDGFALGTG